MATTNSSKKPTCHLLHLAVQPAVLAKEHQRSTLGTFRLTCVPMNSSSTASSSRLPTRWNSWVIPKLDLRFRFASVPATNDRCIGLSSLRATICSQRAELGLRLPLLGIFSAFSLSTFLQLASLFLTWYRHPARPLQLVFRFQSRRTSTIIRAADLLKFLAPLASSETPSTYLSTVSQTNPAGRIS